MRALYLASVTAHVLAAILWVGSNLVIALALAPLLRDVGARGPALLLLRRAGPRLSRTGWGALFTLLLTGLFNLHVRGLLGVEALRSATGSPIGVATVAKLVGIAVIFLVSAMHDLVWGPAATRALERDPRGIEPETARLRSLTRVAGRVGTALSLLLVFAGVVIVRGWF